MVALVGHWLEELIVVNDIAVGVDGAQGGADATALALALAAPGSQIVFGKVVPGDDGRGEAGHGAEDEDVAAVRRMAAGVDGVDTVGMLVRASSVAAGLHRLADEQVADILVVGSHHRRRVAHVWSADLTRATLREAPCPVAVAPRGYAAGPRPEIRSIGIGYDETRQALAALKMGRIIASVTGADLHVLEVVPATNWEGPESTVGRRAAAVGRRLAELDGVETKVVEGTVHGELARFAHEVDLLVLGSHHHGVLHRLVLGDTIGNLTRHVPCALLVMPHPVRRAPRSG